MDAKNFTGDVEMVGLPSKCSVRQSLIVIYLFQAATNILFPKAGTLHLFSGALLQGAGYLVGSCNGLSLRVCDRGFHFQYHEVIVKVHASHPWLRGNLSGVLCGAHGILMVRLYPLRLLVPLVRVLQGQQAKLPLALKPLGEASGAEAYPAKIFEK